MRSGDGGGTWSLWRQRSSRSGLRGSGSNTLCGGCNWSSWRTRRRGTSTRVQAVFGKVGWQIRPEGRASVAAPAFITCGFPTEGCSTCCLSSRRKKSTPSLGRRRRRIVGSVKALRREGKEWRRPRSLLVASPQRHDLLVVCVLEGRRRHPLGAAEEGASSGR